MTDVEVVPSPFGVGWLWVCSTHGRSPVMWVDATLASYDVLGHLAAHHTPHLPSET